MHKPDHQSSVAFQADHEDGNIDLQESKAETTDTSASYEKQYVHDVYSKIANHFSETRYKPWPIITSFINSLPAGSIGFDIGCGNGKYMSLRNDIFILGSDRTPELVSIAKGKYKQHEAIVGDVLGLPHLQQSSLQQANNERNEDIPDDTIRDRNAKQKKASGRERQRGVDFAICIAVLHHLSTRERRVLGVREILACLRPVPTTSSNPPTTSADSITTPSSPSTTISQTPASRPAQALLFVWALEQSTSRRGWSAGGEQDVMVPWVLKNQEGGSGSTYQRYYHLYREGELEEDVVAAGGRVVQKGYDRDNWWCVAERTD